MNFYDDRLYIYVDITSSLYNSGCGRCMALTVTVIETGRCVVTLVLKGRIRLGYDPLSPR